MRKGNEYRPRVHVLKTNNGVPTKVFMSGKVYAMIDDDYINGNKNKFVTVKTNKLLKFNKNRN